MTGTASFSTTRASTECPEGNSRQASKASMGEVSKPLEYSHYCPWPSASTMWHLGRLTSELRTPRLFDAETETDFHRICIICL